MKIKKRVIPNMFKNLKQKAQSKVYQKENANREFPKGLTLDKIFNSLYREIKSDIVNAGRNGESSYEVNLQEMDYTYTPLTVFGPIGSHPSEGVMGRWLTSLKLDTTIEVRNHNLLAKYLPSNFPVRIQKTSKEDGKIIAIMNFIGVNEAEYYFSYIRVYEEDWYAKLKNRLVKDGFLESDIEIYTSLDDDNNLKKYLKVSWK